MDTGMLLGVAVVLGTAFLATSQAKDSEGKKYGIKKMSRIWIIALGVLGLYSLMNPSIPVEEGESVRIPLVPLILISLPFLMIGSNIIQACKRKKASRVDK